MTIAIAGVVAVGSSTVVATQDGELGGSIRPLVSRPAGEEHGIWWATIAGNGRTAFVWTRDALLPDLPATDRYRLFAVDIATSRVRLVSDDGRLQPLAVSSDGAFVVASYELANQQETAVVVDTVTGSVHAIDLPEPLTSLREASISGDGSIVALGATTGLGSTLSPVRLFIADVASGSVSEPLAGADGALFDIHLNRDGTVVAFASQAENLDLPLGNRGSEAVVLDRVAATLEYVSIAGDGGVPDGQSVVDGLSPDGNRVLFRSGASNLLGAERSSGPTTFQMRPFLYDRSTRTTVGFDIEAEGAVDPNDVRFVEHDADLTVLVMAVGSDGHAVRYDVAERRSSNLYGPGVEPAGPLWSSALDPLALDDSGDIAIILSDALNLGPDADSITDAFIIGAAAPDPSAAVFVPPTPRLPPDLLSPVTVSPTPIEPPTTAPPPTTVPRSPDGSNVPTTPAPEAPVPTPPSPTSEPSGGVLDIGCRIGGVLGFGEVPCRQTASIGLAVLIAVASAVLTS